MIAPEQYELLDFGKRRKLERIGGVVLDRPSPAADGSPLSPELWPTAEAKFEGKGEKGRWSGSLPDAWTFQHGRVQMTLRLTDFGHIGVFVEQAVNWEWIHKKVSGRENLRVLNLFAYTGGSTMAAAAAGAQVVHVDASKSVVNWASRNAERSQLSSAPIRWIVEDAAKFVRREVKRGNEYDGIILDPPSYGHGPKGETWKISRDLVPLLQDCRKLLSKTPAFFLLSCHSPGFGAAELNAFASDCLFGSCGAGVQTRALALRTGSGRKLAAGYAAYWP